MTIDSNTIGNGGAIIAADGLKSFFTGFNPLSAVNTLNALAGSKVKLSKTSATGEATSGFADFSSGGEIRFGGASIDLANPVHVVVLAGGLVGVIWLYHKKIKGNL